MIAPPSWNPVLYLYNDSGRRARRKIATIAEFRRSALIDRRPSGIMTAYEEP
jgi:hypothetical protein